VEGVAADLSSPLLNDCSVEPVMAESGPGLEVLRHSTAHLLAHAVKRLYPSAQVTIGPVIDDGFYYDFAYPAGFGPEDLEKIEAEMSRIIAEDHPVAREELHRDSARALFADKGEEYKAEIIDDLDEPTVSLYRQGDFVDLCRGPHVPSTGQLGVFKLTHVAGAYWRGDEKRPMLQRIYGTAFAKKKELSSHLARIEEARKRDHRKIGKDLGLFSFHPEAPASPFFHPDGATLYNQLVSYIRGLYTEYGYEEVITPQILDVDLWHRSGHYDNYVDNMYFTTVDDKEFAVKPMNCPTHCLMFSEGKKSYRDLPIRMADFGRLHRYERSGVVHGLARVRSFCQDDAHIFCRPEDIESEISGVLHMINRTHRAFGFEESKVYLSTRPAKSIGSDQMWEQAEVTLRAVLEKEAPGFIENPGDGAFYGPKIDFAVIDAMKREWQLSTIQLDFSMPERFSLRYVDSDGGERCPVMIHRAVLGSLERFMAILLEHTGGALPLWLAPCQVRFVTVTDRQNEYAAAAVEQLKSAGIRARADLRNEKLGFKIREAQKQKVPVIAVVGDREVEDGTVAPRLHGDSQLEAMSLADFSAWLIERNDPEHGGVS
jgi:threonyl-tRNA synthetase